MAFTLVINSKGLFGKVKSIQMAELLKNCGLKYGSNNELAKEIERQFKKASFYCTEEKRNYTMDELENKEEAMAALEKYESDVYSFSTPIGRMYEVTEYYVEDNETFDIWEFSKPSEKLKKVLEEEKG